MDHAITVRDIFWPLVGIGGVVIVLGVVVWVLSIFADAWKH